MINSRKKGSRGELEFSKLCTEKGYDTYRTQQYCGAAGDADVTGLEGLHVEVKRVERLYVHDAMKQAISDAATGTMPIVAHRRNHQPWLITMEADAFFTLYKAWRETFVK